MEEFNKVRPAHFSIEALGYIFDYCEERGNSEFDPVQICCSWTEFTSKGRTLENPEDYYLTTPLANGNVLTLGY